MILLEIIRVALGVVVIGGWPFVAFVHYRLRRRYKRPASLLLSIAPNLGTILADTLLFSDGFLGRHHRSDWLAVFYATLCATWITLPYLLLATWAFRAFRHRPPSNRLPTQL